MNPDRKPPRLTGTVNHSRRRFVLGATSAMALAGMPAAAPALARPAGATPPGSRSSIAAACSMAGARAFADASRSAAAKPA